MSVENLVILFIMLAISGGAFWGVKRLCRKLQSEFNQNGIIPLPNGEGRNLSLTRINGCGMAFTGKFREATIDNVHTYVTYYTLHLLFIPLIPFKAYRVVPSQDDGYYILGSENMVKREIGVNMLRLVAWGLLIIAVLFFITNL